MFVVHMISTEALVTSLTFKVALYIRIHGLIVHLVSSMLGLPDRLPSLVGAKLRSEA